MSNNSLVTELSLPLPKLFIALTLKMITFGGIILMTKFVLLVTFISIVPVVLCEKLYPITGGLEDEGGGCNSVVKASKTQLVLIYLP